MKNEITARKEKAIVALIKTDSIVAASNESGIPVRTLRNWLHDPNFSSAYEEALNSIIPAACKVIFGMQAKAAQALGDLMDNPTQPGASIKLKTSVKCLELGLKYQDVLIIQEKIKRLEEIEKNEVR